MRKEITVTVSIEGNKMYMNTYHRAGNTGEISTKIDVTPIFEFLKEVFSSEQGKKLLTNTS